MSSSSKWSELKNRTGSLLLPSDELVTSIHLFDSVFMEIHGKDISRENDPMGETKHAIMKAQNRWPRSVMKVKASSQYWTTSKNKKLCLFFK